MLVDEVGQHGARLLFPFFTHDAGAAPGRLLPDQQAQLIAEVKHHARLLIVAKADEVCTHGLDQLQFLAELVIGLGGGNFGVVHMALCTAQQQALAVEFEGTVIDKLRVPDAEPLPGRAFARLRLER